MTIVPHPTTDLYLRHSCNPLIRRWWRKGPLERIGANSFISGDRLLLLRRDEPAVMDRALGWPGKLLYLIDDDIDAAASSTSLPAAYRAKLTCFAETYYSRLLRRADALILSSDALAARLEVDRRVRADLFRLDPFWGLPFAGQTHFASRRTARLDVVHLGTTSHSGGLHALGPALLELLAEFPALRFTFFGLRGTHPSLEAHPHVRRIAPMRWSAYRRWLTGRRFHVAVYPLESTRFDRARSANKLLEHAIVGAVGVYPADWQPASILGDAAIAAPSDPTLWHQCLRDVSTRPSTLGSMAKRASGILIPYTDPTIQRSFWSRLLGFEAART